MRELIHSGQLTGHSAVVVGAGRSGLAAARLLATLGAEVRLLERDPDKSVADIHKLTHEFGIERISGPHAPEHFSDREMVVLSPGVSRRSIEPFLPTAAVQVFSELELASWFVSEPIVAVTGTNGKSTTTTLISHVLEGRGKTFAGGNLGTPLSEYVLGGEQASYLVLEVSSFQLQNISSFHPRVAVLLNIAPNHLDYHQDMQEYFEAKLMLFRNQTANDLAVLPFGLKEVLDEKADIKARQVYFMAADRFPCEPLPGRHNQENLEAAFHACRFFGVSEQEFAQRIRSYTPLPHRLQLVGEKNGVVFIDDSKATTVDALKVALESMQRPVHLLVGGVFKGGDLASLIPLLKQKVRSVALYGANRPIFEEAWQSVVPLSWDKTLAEAVQRVAGGASPGDAVLLSPATASFDQFANYKERGLAFQKAVQELA